MVRYTSSQSKWGDVLTTGSAGLGAGISISGIRSIELVRIADWTCQ